MKNETTTKSRSRIIVELSFFATILKILLAIAMLLTSASINPIVFLLAIVPLMIIDILSFSIAKKAGITLTTKDSIKINLFWVIVGSITFIAAIVILLYTMISVWVMSSSSANGMSGLIILPSLLLFLLGSLPSAIILCVSVLSYKIMRSQYK